MKLKTFKQYFSEQEEEKGKDDNNDEHRPLNKIMWGIRNFIGNPSGTNSQNYFAQSGNQAGSFNIGRSYDPIGSPYRTGGFDPNRQKRRHDPDKIMWKFESPKPDQKDDFALNFPNHKVIERGNEFFTATLIPWDDKHGETDVDLENITSKVKSRLKEAKHIEPYLNKMDLSSAKWIRRFVWEGPREDYLKIIWKIPAAK